MRAVTFSLHGRFGHFLKAEAGVCAMTYLVPPRTALLGVIGAVLGLEKDAPQRLLEPCRIAVSGATPATLWHKAKLRKDPPTPLPWVIAKKQQEEKATAPEKATLIYQEWLFNPRYLIHASLPDPYHNEFEARLKERRWHFQPCLGLSEMLADLEWVWSGMAEALPDEHYPITSVIPQDQCVLDMERIFKEELVLNVVSMPRAVSADRVFTHAGYYVEKNGAPVPLKTAHGFKLHDTVIMFL